MEHVELEPTLSEDKSSKIKVFQEIKKNFGTFGLSPSLVSQACPLNEKILLNFLIHIFAAFTTFEFVLHGAQNFVEYTQSIYMFSLSMLIIETMANMVFKVEELFDLMSGAESIVNTSE